MRIAVIGGGIAGVAAAHELSLLRPDAQIDVYEASPRLGGKLVSGSVAGATVDLGAESILARRPEGVDLVHAVGLGPRLVHPESVGAAIWTGGELRPLPPTVMGIPADLDALERSGIIADWPAFARESGARDDVEKRSPRTGDADMSVADFVRSRLGDVVGQQIVDRLIEPLLGGVYAGHASRLSLQSAAPQIAALGAQGSDLLAAARRQVAMSRSLPAEPVFAGLTGGVGQLPAAVAHASGATIHLKATVRAVERRGNSWRLSIGPTTAVAHVDVDAVIIATPAAPAARLLADVAPRAAADLAAIDYASMAIVTLALPTAALTALPTGSGFLVPPVDGKAVKAVTFSTNKWGWLAHAAGPELTVIRCSIGRAGETRTLQRGDSGLIAAALADLREAIGPTGEPVDALVQRWGGALPQYDFGHAARIASAAADLRGVNGLEVCGAAYAGIGIPAVIASAHRAAERLDAWLETMDS